MKRYSLSHFANCKSRKISLDFIKAVPSYAKLDVLEFGKSPKEYFGSHEVGFEVYSNKTLNKAKLLNLFFKLKRECQTEDNFSKKVVLTDEYFL